MNKQEYELYRNVVCSICDTRDKCKRRINNIDDCINETIRISNKILP